MKTTELIKNEEKIGDTKHRYLPVSFNKEELLEKYPELATLTGKETKNFLRGKLGFEPLGQSSRGRHTGWFASFKKQMNIDPKAHPRDVLKQLIEEKRI